MMTTFDRSTGQSIEIGPDIRVTVLQVQNDRVSLGITAPVELPIVRFGKTVELDYKRPAKGTK